MSVENETRSWADELISNYREGFSDAEVAAAMNITMREFYKQIKENPSFSKLVEYGRTLSLAFWEGLARKNIRNKEFNTSLYNFYMKNKHGWADKVETSNTTENTNISLDALREEISRKLKRLKDQNTPELADAKRILQPRVETDDED